MNLAAALGVAVREPRAGSGVGLMFSYRSAGK